MERKKRSWSAIGLLAMPIGFTVGRLHLIGPNPGTYFTLGMLAALSVAGLIYGIREAKRIIRSGGPMGN